MTPEQQAELRQEANFRADCADALAARDCQALAELLSAGRTCGNDREVGYGTILEVIGVSAGNQLIDFIQAQPDMRHVRPLLEQGRLRIGSQLVQQSLQSFVGAAAVTQADADALCALGLQPDPLTAQQVGEALFHPDGSEKE
jgi:thiamine biosynthesis protein ThiC